MPLRVGDAAATFITTTRMAREQSLSPEQRLRFHQEHSGPLMKALHEWMEAQLAERKTEPNSGLGKAISYLLQSLGQADALSASNPGLPSTTTSWKGALKKAILNRKNALFYRTLNGAAGGRSVHESDPHLRAERSQSVRLSDRVAAARRGVEAKPVGVDAVELPRDAGAARHARLRNMMNPAWPKRIDCGQVGVTSPKCP